MNKLLEIIKVLIQNPAFIAVVIDLLDHLLTKKKEEENSPK